MNKQEMFDETIRMLKFTAKTKLKETSYEDVKETYIDTKRYYKMVVKENRRHCNNIFSDDEGSFKCGIKHQNEIKLCDKCLENTKGVTKHG